MPILTYRRQKGDNNQSNDHTIKRETEAEKKSEGKEDK